MNQIRLSHGGSVILDLITVIIGRVRGLKERTLAVSELRSNSRFDLITYRRITVIKRIFGGGEAGIGAGVVTVYPVGLVTPVGDSSPAPPERERRKPVLV